MAHHPDGIDAGQLSDTVLARELATLHATRHETFLEASDDALAAHTSGCCCWKANTCGVSRTATRRTRCAPAPAAGPPPGRTERRGARQ